MALNPAFADASINPSQSMGNDASVNPTQGALPTGQSNLAQTQDSGTAGFSGLGGLDINYSAPQEPLVPMIPNFNQSYYQSPQYQSYQNNLNTTAATDDYVMMPFGGYGSGNIANLQNQSYDDFLKNPSMGQPATQEVTNYQYVNPNPRIAYFEDKNNYGGDLNTQLKAIDDAGKADPQYMAYFNKTYADRNNNNSLFNGGSGDQMPTMPQDYVSYLNNQDLMNKQNSMPYQSQYNLFGQPSQSANQGMAFTEFPDGTPNPRGNYYNAGVEGWYNQPGAPTYEQWQANPSLATEFQNRQAQQPNPSLQAPTPMPQSNIARYDIPKNPDGSYNSEGVMVNQPQGIPRESFFTGPNAGKVPMGFSMVNGEMVRDPNYQGPPEQQPGPTPPPLAPQQQDYTNPSDFEGLTFATSMDGLQNAPIFEYGPDATREDKLRNMAPYMTRENYARNLNELRRPADSILGSTGGVQQPVQQPQVLNGVTGTPASPLTPTATPTGTTPMATNPLSQVPVDPAAAYTPAPTVGTPSSGGGSFTQGAPLPNITTTQQQVTAAPAFYTDYLNQLAKQGASTAQNAQYVGATDLQNQAFNQTAQNVGNYQPALQSAINMAQNVGNSNLSEAIGNLGQANIARNLAPQATAGIVGSGQFGSKRGAAALGDTIANAQLGITAQQAQALQQDMQNRIAAAQQLGNLASTTQQLGLGDINALATMGGQKQTIAQNEQLFPMQQLTNQSQLLRGYTIPTSTGSSYTGPIPGAYAASPLQQIAGLGALGAGISQTNLGTAIGKLFGGATDASTGALSKLLGINTGGTGAITDVNGNTTIPEIPGAGSVTVDDAGNYIKSDGTVIDPSEYSLY